LDANGNVGIANVGYYYTEQTGTPALDIALYSSATTPMYYFVEKNAPSTNFLQVYPTYDTVYNEGGSSVTNAAYVATNKNGNLAYVDLNGGLYYSGKSFGIDHSFTTVLSSGAIRVALSTTRLWYIDTSNDVWYADLGNLGTLIKTNGSKSTEISSGDGGGGGETTAVTTNSFYSYNIYVYDTTAPIAPADGSFPATPVSTPDGALDIGVYNSGNGIYIDHTSEHVVFTNSF
jgi:hypothetical protein